MADGAPETGTRASLRPLVESTRTVRLVSLATHTRPSPTAMAFPITATGNLATTAFDAGSIRSSVEPVVDGATAHTSPSPAATAVGADEPDGIRAWTTPLSASTLHTSRSLRCPIQSEPSANAIPEGRGPTENELTT